ncbi:hypothetical protein DL764_000241 [Monosporascus ibericus]|uniref:NmrA-like domain-containing protein n=1 Tax=Monosporascus ibericus TaxID=155417 RepID=A0A4Q4TZK3_9PEZI|nr:hypothetical protein DL764_000241 [Monosporascus ibericus]
MATYLITQATGQQSQWVVRHLLSAGTKVHAMVRNLQKVPPILQSLGVTLFQGESKNFEDIFRAAQGCKGVFLNNFPLPGLEALQARTVIEACEKAGVETIVASTTFCVNHKAMWDDDGTKEIQLHHHFASKAAVEDLVRGSSFQAYTILRPAVIHHEYFLPGSPHNFPRLASHRELDDLLNEGARVPHTDGHDVGKYAAAALQDPTKFCGQEIDLTNEEVRTIKRTPAELEKMGISVFGQKFHLWANIKDFRSLIAANNKVLAKFGIPLTSLEAALQRDKALLLERLPAK